MGEQNVRIAGAGRIQGGTYNQVKISGSGRVEGDLQAEEFSSAGSALVDGNLKARRFDCAGSFKCRGELEVDEGEAAGAFSVKGKIKAKELKLAGAIRCRSVQGGYLRGAGRLEVDENVEVETFRFAGAFKIQGLLSADKVEIELRGESEAQEIGGEKIEIRRSARSLAGIIEEVLDILFLSPSGHRLRTNLIEGDEVHLEAVEAEVVRGGRIKIGPGCRIGRVEYTESLEVDPQAKVGEEVKE